MLTDNNGTSCFVDNNGITCWVDNAGNTLCCQSGSTRGRVFASHHEVPVRKSRILG